MGIFSYDEMREAKDALIRQKDAEIEELQGEQARLQHIIGVLKHHILAASYAAREIEANVQIHDGRLVVWCLGEWVDVVHANKEDELDDEEDE